MEGVGEGSGDLGRVGEQDVRDSFETQNCRRNVRVAKSTSSIGVVVTIARRRW
ncbi:hypothetical protein EBESD8_8270 [Rhodococcus aetherivorans]|nr:hypothetical protein EBESD8_8270 [Rhodococcus aetherivorans]